MQDRDTLFAADISCRGFRKASLRLHHVFLPTTASGALPISRVLECIEESQSDLRCGEASLRPTSISWKAQALLLLEDGGRGHNGDLSDNGVSRVYPRPTSISNTRCKFREKSVESVLVFCYTETSAETYPRE